MPGPNVRTGITPNSHTAPENTLYQFLTDDGTETGAIDANGDYSVTAEGFYIQASSEYLVIERMLGMIEDTGKLIIGGYGAITSPLTNGITLLILDRDGATVMESSFALKTNEDWANVCYDWTVHAFDSTTNTKQVGTFRWTFGKSGNPVVLKPQEKMVLRFNDDLTGLDKHRFHVQGWRM